jgi:hypothetical protein
MIPPQMLTPLARLGRDDLAGDVRSARRRRSGPGASPLRRRLGPITLTPPTAVGGLPPGGRRARTG